MAKKEPKTNAMRILDKNKINTFRFTNCNNVVTTSPTIVNITLRILFFVLLILFHCPL